MTLTTYIENIADTRLDALELFPTREMVTYAVQALYQLVWLDYQATPEEMIGLERLDRFRALAALAGEEVFSEEERN